uniref:Uncharacterized protein n=1 Tax=Anguilla anguilla TaxID=7936 RepID=A0A0E9W422_ANGAN
MVDGMCVGSCFTINFQI